MTADAALHDARRAIIHAWQSYPAERTGVLDVPPPNRDEPHEEDAKMPIDAAVAWLPADESSLDTDRRPLGSKPLS